MPDDLKSRVPEKIAIYVSLVFLVGAAVARVIMKKIKTKIINEYFPFKI